MSEDLGPLVQSHVKGMMANRSGVSVLGVPMGPDAYIKTFLRGRANMAQIRQSRPDSGLGFQVKVPKSF